jgi:hypothetical protein
VGKRTFVVVVVVFVLLVIAVAAMQGGNDGMLADWLRSMHGR